MRLRLFWLLLGSLLFTAAQGCVSYTAPLPQTARKGSLQVSVKQLSARPGDHVHVAMVVDDVPPDAVLIGATLSDSDDACQGQHAERMGRERGRTAEQPLVAGERISLAFGEYAARSVGGVMPTLGLILRTRGSHVRCVPFALSETLGEPLEWKPEQHFTVGLDITLEGFTSQLGSVQQVLTVPLTFGVWLDRLHLDIGAGIGGAGCHIDNCAVTDSDTSKIEYTTTYPMLAGASVLLLETSGGFLLGTGARYRAMYVTAETYEGHEGFWTHGVLLTPYVGLTDPAALGRGARIAAGAIEMPFGYTFASNGDRSFTIGFQLRLWVTVF